MGKTLKAAAAALAAVLLLGYGSCGTARAAENTSYVRTLRTVNGKVYYYTAKGTRLKNAWRTIRGKRYYFTKTGAAATGAAKVNGKRFVFSQKGVLQRNKFLRINGRCYYAGANGAAATGWKTINGKRYYFSSRGVRAENGFKTIGGKTYYFTEKGVLKKNCWIDGKYMGSDGAWRTEKSWRDMSLLKTQLNAQIRTYSGVWSVYVKDLDTGQSLEIMNESVYAASVIKLYAMAAAYQRIEDGLLDEGAWSGTIRSMITVSSNDAFNAVVSAIGLTYINEWCRENGYTGTQQGHGIPNTLLINGSGYNLTTVENCGRLLESIYRGTCVSRTASDKMLNILKGQTMRSKIPAGVPSGTVVANKTGETDDFCHDVGIVWSPKATYILCVTGDVNDIAMSLNGQVAALSRITYNFFNS